MSLVFQPRAYIFFKILLLFPVTSSTISYIICAIDEIFWVLFFHFVYKNCLSTGFCLFRLRGVHWGRFFNCWVAVGESLMCVDLLKLLRLFFYIPPGIWWFVDKKQRWIVIVAFSSLVEILHAEPSKLRTFAGKVKCLRCSPFLFVY